MMSNLMKAYSGIGLNVFLCLVLGNELSNVSDLLGKLFPEHSVIKLFVVVEKKRKFKVEGLNV